MDKVKRLARCYADLWRDLPGTMTMLHVTVTGFVVVAALLVRDPRDGLAAFLVFLGMLLTIVPTCAEMDLRK